MKKIQIKLYIATMLTGFFLTACNDQIDYSFQRKNDRIDNEFFPRDSIIEFGRDSASLLVAATLHSCSGVSDAEWCKVVNRGHEIYITAKANTTGSNRNTQVILNGNDTTYKIKVTQAAFVHPGILHTADAIRRVKDLALRQPWPGGASYYILEETSFAKKDYAVKNPIEILSHFQSGAQYGKEFYAAYLNAWMWILTQKEEHAQKAMQIIRGYGEKMKSISESAQEPMWLGGFAGSTWANAVELMRYTYPAVQYENGWNSEDTRNTDRICRIFADYITAFLENEDLKYNGGAYGVYATSGIKGLIASGVFLNDKVVFDRAVEEFKSGNTVGAIGNFILPGGQNLLTDVETQHSYSQWELGSLSETCEIAWNQGIDLYGEKDNRLKEGFEYEAAYLQGKEMICQPWPVDYPTLNQTGNVVSTTRALKPVWEIAYNHYVKRKGIAMPNAEVIVNRNRPEGYDNANDPIQHSSPGFGTLLFYIDK